MNLAIMTDDVCEAMFAPWDICQAPMRLLDLPLDFLSNSYCGTGHYLGGIKAVLHRKSRGLLRGLVSQ